MGHRLVINRVMKTERTNFFVPSPHFYHRPDPALAAVDSYLFPLLESLI